MSLRRLARAAARARCWCALVAVLGSPVRAAPPPAATAPPAAPTTAATTASAAPWTLDRSTFDPSADPCEDFTSTCAAAGSAPRSHRAAPRRSGRSEPDGDATAVFPPKPVPRARPRSGSPGRGPRPLRDGHRAEWRPEGHEPANESNVRSFSGRFLVRGFDLEDLAGTPAKASSRAGPWPPTWWSRRRSRSGSLRRAEPRTHETPRCL
jgi:hypothetical protein